MRRISVPAIAANEHERRIIALENFMLSTPLRNQAALAAFNEKERLEGLKPAKALVEPDPGGRKLKAWLANQLANLHAMRRARGACIECGKHHGDSFACLSS